MSTPRNIAEARPESRGLPRLVGATRRCAANRIAPRRGNGQREHLELSLLTDPKSLRSEKGEARGQHHRHRRRNDDLVLRVQQGQGAEIRFTAFKYRTTRLVEGKVFYLAPDRTLDRVTNQAYYVALVEADAGSLANAGEFKLQAGMPAEVYINGEQRTPLQYLVEPVTQVLRRAGRER